MKKIKTKILLVVLANMLIISISLGGVSFYTISQDNKKSIEQMDQQLRDNYDESIKLQINIIITGLNGIVNQINQGIISQEEGKIIAADMVRNARYGEEGYFWIDDTKGNNIVSMGDEETEGTNRLDLEDVNGQYIVKDLLLIAANGGGYYDYEFQKVGSDEVLPKRAYIKMFEPFDWTIGTGNYTDDINLMIENEEKIAFDMIRKSMVLMGIIFVLSIILGCVISLRMSSSITTPIIILTDLINKTATLDIAKDSNYNNLTKYKDEIGIMSNAVFKLRKSLRSIIAELKVDATTLDHSSDLLGEIITSSKGDIEGVTTSVSELASGAQEQATDAEMAVKIMDILAQEIGESVQRAEKLMENTEEVNKMNSNGVKLVFDLSEKFELTRRVTEELNRNVSNLSENSTQIQDIVETIKSIAGQTNLLSLNAAIEAARAGEAGKGFSVVADEIRKLAEQTSHSTTQIETIIGTIISEIDIIMGNMQNSKEAVVVSSVVVKDVQASFESIEGAVESTFDELKMLITNIDNVNRNKDEVMEAIHDISSIIEESASGSEEIYASMESQSENIGHIKLNSDELNNIASKLNQIIEKFKL